MAQAQFVKTVVVPNMETFVAERWGLPKPAEADEQVFRGLVMETVFLTSHHTDFRERMDALDVFLGKNPTWLPENEAAVCRHICGNNFADAKAFWRMVNYYDILNFRSLVREREQAEYERLENERRERDRKAQADLIAKYTTIDLTAFLKKRGITRKQGESTVSLRRRAFVELFLRSARTDEAIRFEERGGIMEVLIGFHPEHLRPDNRKYASNFCSADNMPSLEFIERFADKWQEILPSALDILKRLGLEKGVVEREAVAV